MIPMQFDFGDLREEFSMTQKDIDGLLDFTVKEVTAHFANEWEQVASRELKSSRNLYMRSIVVSNPGKFMGAVELVNDVPNMIESGRGPYDMKPILLGGGKVKIGSDGSRYNTIPFSIGVPTSLPENFSTILPEPVYGAILQKPFEVSIPGGVRTKGLTSPEIPEKYRTPITKQVPIPESKAFGEYTHKSSIYQGIVRQKSEVTGQNSYVSFRRVSENSDPLSWIHPGFTAKNLAEKALETFNAPAVSSKAIDKYLTQFGFASE